MDLTTLLGLAAGLFTTASLVPQALEIWKSKSAKDVSLTMFVAFAAGVAMWLAYGLLRGELPIVVWNAVSLVLATAIVAMKLRYR